MSTLTLYYCEESKWANKNHPIDYHSIFFLFFFKKFLISMIAIIQASAYLSKGKKKKIQVLKWTSSLYRWEIKQVRLNLSLDFQQSNATAVRHWAIPIYPSHHLQFQHTCTEFSSRIWASPTTPRFSSF